MKRHRVRRNQQPPQITGRLHLALKLFCTLLFSLPFAICGIAGLMRAFNEFEDEAIAFRVFVVLFSLCLLSVSLLYLWGTILWSWDLFVKPVTVTARVLRKWEHPGSSRRHDSPKWFLELDSEQGPLSDGGDEVSQHQYESVDVGNLVVLSYWPHSETIHCISVTGSREIR